MNERDKVETKSLLFLPYTHMNCRRIDEGVVPEILRFNWLNSDCGLLDLQAETDAVEEGRRLKLLA